VDTLSGGEKRRVAMCRAIVSLPDFLILDEPTNHLDPESIDWVADFLDEFHGSFLVVTHDRYFLDRVAKRMLELYDGKFWSHNGNYTDYLLAKAERQEADATVEHKRQMFLKKELAWVRQGPRAQRSKQKDRFERYYDEAAKDGPDRGGHGTRHPAAAATRQSHRGGNQSRHDPRRKETVQRVQLHL
jgi:ATP-binding cassette subfamily F protein uup